MNRWHPSDRLRLKLKAGSFSPRLGFFDADDLKEMGLKDPEKMVIDAIHKYAGNPPSITAMKEMNFEAIGRDIGEEERKKVLKEPLENFLDESEKRLEGQEKIQALEEAKMRRINASNNVKVMVESYLSESLSKKCGFLGAQAGHKCPYPEPHEPSQSVSKLMQSYPKLDPTDITMPDATQDNNTKSDDFSPTPFKRKPNPPSS